MKKVVFFFSVLIGFLFILDKSLALVLDHFYPQIYYGEKGGDINYYLSLKEVPDVLSIGSSRVKHHIIPDSLSLNAFNLAHNGMRLPFHVGLIALLASSEKMPRKILLQIEPYFFDHLGNQKPKLGFNDAQFLRYYYGKNKLVTEYINRISSTEKYKFLFSLYRYNGNILALISNYFKSRYSYPTHNGFFPLAYDARDTIHLDAQIWQLADTSVLSTSVEKQFINETAVSYLDDVIKICEDANTSIIFFTAPYYSIPNQSKSRLFLKEYFKKNDIDYFDFNSVKISKLKDKKYWRDNEHLNIEGAKIFTLNLRKRLYNF